LTEITSIDCGTFWQLNPIPLSIFTCIPSAVMEGKRIKSEDFLVTFVVCTASGKESLPIVFHSSTLQNQFATAAKYMGLTLYCECNITDNYLLSWDNLWNSPHALTLLKCFVSKLPQETLMKWKHLSLDFPYSLKEFREKEFSADIVEELWIKALTAFESLVDFGEEHWYLLF
jgi:hypothetical protein